jgi:hypothetical protein
MEPMRGNVRSLRPIRVLVAGRDARYVRATAFLLGRCGFDARRLRHGPSLLHDPRLATTDVLLLEAEAATARAAVQANAVLAAFDRVAVVVAANGPFPASGGRVEVVEKWASLDEVVAAVERAWTAVRAAPLAERSAERRSA